MFLTILKGIGLKGFAIIALVIAVGGYLWYNNNKIEKLKQQAIDAQAERDKAIADKAVVVEVNKANQVVIDQLQTEKADIQESLNNLEAARKKDSVIIGNLSSSIKAQASNPANQVKLSPVLQDTINKIQQERDARAASGVSR